MTSLQLMLARVLYAVEEYHQADAPAVAGEDDARQAAKGRVSLTYDAIVAEVEEVRGLALVKSLSDPHRDDLPVRHHETGQIVAWVQSEFAAGMMPVVYNGFVVGYYKDTPNGRLHPVFNNGKVWRLSGCRPGEEWGSEFTASGEQCGSFLVRTSPS